MAKKPKKEDHQDIRIPDRDIRIEKDNEGFKKNLEKALEKDEHGEKK